MNRKQILETAISTICRDRQDQYGSAKNNFQLVADLWSNYLGVQITPADFAMLMCLLKIARSKANPAHMDNLIDMAGYAALASEMVEEKPVPEVSGS